MQQNFISILRYITILSDNTELFFSRSFEKQNLSSSRQIALLKIYENPGLTMSQLGQVTHYQKSAISKIVNELIEKSYITMTIDAQDRRIKHLYPTSKADQPIASILELRNWWLDQLFEGYSAQERETLYQCLIALARRSSIILVGEKINVQKNSYFYYAAVNALFYFSRAMFASMITVYLAGESLSTSEISLVASAFSLFAIVTQPICGLIADKIQSPKIVSIGCGALAICTGIAFVSTYAFILLFLLNGLDS